MSSTRFIVAFPTEELKIYKELAKKEKKPVTELVRKAMRQTYYKRARLTEKQKAWEKLKAITSKDKPFGRPSELKQEILKRYDQKNHLS